MLTMAMEMEMVKINYAWNNYIRELCQRLVLKLVIKIFKAPPFGLRPHPQAKTKSKPPALGSTAQLLSTSRQPMSLQLAPNK